MGKFNEKPIEDCKIQCVLESEGGFIFASHTMKLKLIEKNTNLAIFDFGGGIYDLTVVKIREGQDPKIIISDFGEAAGGSDVDNLFMKDIETFIDLSKANLPEKDKSIIMFNILADF